jgi:predicted DCC family thiol-disulfide oxidoreductase YuxK
MRPVMLYCGTCRLCRWAARVVAKADRSQQLAFLPLGDPDAARLLEAVSEETRMASWWLVSRDGEPVAGNNGGGVALLLELRATRPLGRLLRAAKLSPAVDFLDDLIARHRSAIGRVVRDGPGPRRYP